MTVINRWHKLPPTPPHKALDCARMSIAGKRSSNLLQYWGAQVCNYTHHGQNEPPQSSYKSTSTTSQEIQLLSLLSQGVRNRPYNELYGLIVIEKPSTMEGILSLHMVPGVIWPESSLAQGELYSWEIKTGFTTQDFRFFEIPVPSQLTQSSQDFTAWLSTRRTNTITGTIELLAAGIQWVRQ